MSCRPLIRIALVAVALVVAVSATAQTSADRRKLLDSLANPALSQVGKMMSFSSEVIDAGTMGEEDEPREYVFEWTNVGEVPLCVVNVTTTCACAQPSFGREMVKPGETSQLKVTYRPKGHPGSFDRRIFVYAVPLQGGDASGQTGQGGNASRPAAVLHLKGNVEPSTMPVWGYPVAMGSLRLKRDSVSFTRGVRAVETIACINAGTDSMTVGADERLLPPVLSVTCIPQTVGPGEECEIRITYDPSAAGTTDGTSAGTEPGFAPKPGHPSVMPVVITGPHGLGPSQRTVKVHVTATP